MEEKKSPVSGEAIAIGLTITACIILVVMTLMLGIQIYRKEIPSPFLVEILKGSLVSIVSGVLLYTGNKMKNVS